MQWQLNVENISGIEKGSTAFNEGQNIIQASNFKGKSSLIDGMKTALGITGVLGEEHPLTEDEDTGFASLDIKNDEYRVDLSRNLDRVTASGEGYLTDQQDIICTRLFASLDEKNPIRSAVREQNFSRLTELLKKPLDIENIDRKIDTLATKIERLEEEKEDADDAAREIPSVQEEVTTLESEIEELKEERDELEEQVQEDKEQKEIRDNLTNKESRLENTKSRIKSLENKIEAKKSKLQTKKEDLENLEIPDEPEMQSNLAEKREEIDELAGQINLIRDVYRANKNIISEGEIELITDVRRSIQGDDIKCWLSGDETTIENVEENLESIRQKKKKLQNKKSKLESEIEEIESKKSKIRKKKNEKESLESSISQLEFDIKESEEELEEAKQRKDEIKEEVETLRNDFEEIEEELDSELTDIERTVGKKESELSRKKDRLDELDDIVEERNELEEDLADAKDEKESLHEKRSEKEDEIKERFNSAMTEFENRFDPGFVAHLNKKTKPDGSLDKFEVVVARNGKESKITSLSEGEIELIGVMTAIAGHKTFNVDERCPVIIIDGIGQLAAEHIRTLMNYFDESAEIVITTAYPEAGEFSGTTIEPGEWNLVKDKTPA